MKENFKFVTTRKNLIDVSIYGIENIELNPCIILVHGFKGFKDWGFFPYAAEKLAEGGFTTITFNFSHNGVSNGGSDFDELEKFEKNSYSLEVEELSEIIDAYSDGEFGETKNNDLALVAHSRGAISAIINSVNKEKVKSLVTWAGVANIDRFTDRQKKKWKENGYFEIMNMRTNQLMRIGAELLNDLEKNFDNLNLKNYVPLINKPFLIIQGAEDLAVKLSEAELLLSWTDKKYSQFEVIQNCGHTFNIKHPFKTSHSDFEKVLKLTLNFFNKHLK